MVATCHIRTHFIEFALLSARICLFVMRFIETFGSFKTSTGSLSLLVPIMPLVRPEIVLLQQILYGLLGNESQTCILG